MRGERAFDRLPFRSTTTLGSEKKGSHFTLFARFSSLRKKTEREREKRDEASPRGLCAQSQWLPRLVELGLIGILVVGFRKEVKKGAVKRGKRAILRLLISRRRRPRGRKKLPQTKNIHHVPLSLTSPPLSLPPLPFTLSFSSSQLSAAVSVSSRVRASLETRSIDGLVAAARAALIRQPDTASTAALALARRQQHQLQLQLRSSSLQSYKNLAVAVPTALLIGGGTGLGASVAACFEAKRKNSASAPPSFGDNEALFFRPRVPARASRPPLAAPSALSRLGLTPLAASLSRALAALAEEAATCGRALFLALLFAPALAALPLVRLLSGTRNDSSLLEGWSSLLASTLAAAGPAFIKWGQWAATRGDLFPPHVTRALRRLQSDAPRHAAAASVAAVEAAFGGPLSTVFETFDLEPVASGSVAQVHRATLSEAGARAAGAKRGEVVAVKVRHPGAAALISRDFELMRRFAACCAALPAALGGGSWGVNLQESVRQFGAPLREQLDLAIEVSFSFLKVFLFSGFFSGSRESSAAAPLSLSWLRIKKKTGRAPRSVQPQLSQVAQRELPAPARAACHSRSPRRELRERGPDFGIRVWEGGRRQRRKRLDLDLGFAFLFFCGFCRRQAARRRRGIPGQARPRVLPADAAAGQLCGECREREWSNGSTDSYFFYFVFRSLSFNHFPHPCFLPLPLSLLLFPKKRQHADLHPGNILVRDGGKQQQPQQQQKTGDISSLPPPSTFFSRAAAALGLPPPPPHLVLLDVGMAAELAPRDQRSLLRFFKALALRDGRGVGGAVLDFATAASLPASPEAAEPFLSELGALFDSLTAEEVRERTPEVFGKVLSAVREHGVAIRADVSSVVASALVLEGWSSALDPDIRILEKVKAALPLTLRERLERWGDQMVAAPALF